MSETDLDYHRLVWQEISKSVAGGDQSLFVMTQGKLLATPDYEPDNENSGYNTALLVDNTMKCAVNFADAGSHYSTAWKMILVGGKGPASSRGQVAFNNAKKLLYKVYPTEESDYYKKWNKIRLDNLQELFKLKEKMRNEYGDQWQRHFDEQKSFVPSAADYNSMKDIAIPAETAIKEHQYGEYYAVMHVNEQVFDSYQSKSGDGYPYVAVQMQPTDWYRALDSGITVGQLPWVQITVSSASEDKAQHEKYKMFNAVQGSCAFFNVVGKAEKDAVSTKDCVDISISFKMATVQINRPWFDTSIIKLDDLRIDGVSAGGWSTGQQSPANDGSMPMLNTQIVLAKDISVSAGKFSQKLTDYFKTTDWSASVGSFFGLFSVGTASGSSTTIDHTFSDAGGKCSITLTGAQMIGYTCSAVPTFPH